MPIDLLVDSPLGVEWHSLGSDKLLWDCNESPQKWMVPPGTRISALWLEWHPLESREVSWDCNRCSGGCCFSPRAFYLCPRSVILLPGTIIAGTGQIFHNQFLIFIATSVSFTVLKWSLFKSIGAPGSFYIQWSFFHVPLIPEGIPIICFSTSCHCALWVTFHGANVAF